MKYIYGLNRSGKSIIDYLDRIKEKYLCWDDDEKLRKKLKKNNKLILFVEPDNIDCSLVNECFVTPGISLKHKNIIFLKRKKIKIYRDLELYSRITEGIKIIAVTGTNGKSTTTKLISDILKKSKISNFTGGNIGIPLLDFVKKKNKIDSHVIELSSFQLESCSSFKPDISILLNISPDHLDRYSSYKKYISQKEKIIKSNKSHFNIVCIDDQETKLLYKKYRKKIIPISKKFLTRGVYYQKGTIKDNFFENKIDVNLEHISPSLFGNFNLENILSAYVVSRILNIQIRDFLNVVKNYKGLPHRLEEIFRNKYFHIVNNSKSTNIDAAIKSIINFKNISLILGGVAKDKNFKKILIHKNKINKIYLIGDSASDIYSQLSYKIPCERCENLNLAIKKIFFDIKNKKICQTILFSPACTSFDQYKNFEERGDHFKRLIKKELHE